jgi:hypothetical protein
MFDDIGVAVADLEASVGRVQGSWTAQDVSQLGVKFKTIHRGEASVEDLFPRVQAQSQVVSIEAIQAQQDAGGEEVPPSDAGDGLAVVSPAPPPAVVEGDDTPSEVGDPVADGESGSPDVVETEVAAALPSPPSPPDVVEVAQPASDETRAAAKAAKAKVRAGGKARDLTAALAAADISAQESKWTEADALRVIEIAEGIG